MTNVQLLRRFCHVLKQGSMRPGQNAMRSCDLQRSATDLSCALSFSAVSFSAASRSRSLATTAGGAFLRELAGQQLFQTIDL